MNLQRRASFSQLPQELIDFIIDHLWEDKSSLAKCCLVSRVWVRRSRHNLFGRIQVVGDHHRLHFESLPKAITGSPESWMHVRQLRLHCRPLEHVIRWTLVDIQLLITVVSNLTSLHTLELAYVRLHASANQTFEYGPLAKPMRKLVFKEVEVDEGCQVWLATLSLFGTVDDLYISFLGGQAHRDNRVPLELPMPPHLRVSRLILQSRFPDTPALQITPRPPAFSSLQKLQVTVYDSHGKEYVGGLLAVLGSTLTCLDLILEEMAFYETDWSSLQLNACVALHTLHVHHALRVGSRVNSLSLLLSQAPRTINEIYICSQVVAERLVARVLRKSDWSLMKDVMSRFTALEALTFQFEVLYGQSIDPLVQQKWKDVITQHLSELYASGILRFQ